MLHTIKSLLLLCLLLVSWQSYSLSCSKIPVHFYFSCVGGECKPEFQVSGKTELGDCERRYIVSEIEQEFRSYLKSQVRQLQAEEDGVYKLTVQFGYWRHLQISDVDDFQAALKKEYGYMFKDYETGEVPPLITINKLIESESHYVSWRCIAKTADLGALKEEQLALQLEGLLQSIIFNTLYWGGFLLCSIFSVYSTNRFYKVLHTKGKTDRSSLLIQLFIFVLCFSSAFYATWTPWVGGILIPFLIVIFVSELTALLQIKIAIKEAGKSLHKP